MEINKKPWPLSTAFKLRDRIDTNPDYQRPAVWSKAQEQLLIESILQGYDIPKLYWRQVSKSPDKYEVVDGQQRLRAIWSYMDNEYALAKDVDPIEGYEVAGRKYKDLDADMMIRFDQYCLDVAILTQTNEEEVREMFLRLQNGTTLKAQEKRNARPGQMRDFVCAVAKHPFFNAVNFSNSRFTYDHIAAQMCLLTLQTKICNIKDRDLNVMYDENMVFDSKSPKARQVMKVLDYLAKMFKSKTPELKRYNVISLYILISNLINRYVIAGREEELAKWFIDFENRRDLDKANPAEEQDPALVAYHEKTAHSTDAFDSLTFRNQFLMEDLFAHVPNLEMRDNQRLFDEVQRRVIYRKFDGICQMCGKLCEWDDYQADHIKPWVEGGATTIENGQVLCSKCNASKGAR